MAASTLGVIVRAREFLQQRSRSLTVRSPSAAVLRVVRACGLSYPAFSPPALVESSELAGDDKTEALGTWVAVPTAERAHGPTSPAPRVLERLTAPADGAAIFLEEGQSASKGWPRADEGPIQERGAVSAKWAADDGNGSLAYSSATATALSVPSGCAGYAPRSPARAVPASC